MPKAKPAGTPGRRPNSRRPGLIFPLDRAKWYRRLEVRAARYKRRITKHEIKFRDLDRVTQNEILAFLDKESLSHHVTPFSATISAGLPIAVANGSEKSVLPIAALSLLNLAASSGAASTNNELLRRVRIRIQHSNNKKIKHYLTDSKYFFIDKNGNVIFTDSNPFLALRKRVRANESDQRPSRGMRAFDRMGDIYFRVAWPYLWSQIQLPFFRYRALRKAADIQKGMTVVEVASGAIPYHSLFRKAVGKEGKLIVGDVNPRVTKDSRRIMRGIQFVERMVRGKKPSEKAEPHYLTFSTKKLPFPDNSVDRVVGSYVYEVDVRELARVLKKGGKFVLVEGGGCRYHELDAMMKRGIIHQAHANGITTLTKLTN
ncbi:MAG: class I SAM-dependent methyltransferase [Candidatus Iainarchaeum archaeon]|uniref:Class I SAM-dependent methyltransferase n=1 Tax=Candidatus Iainarchaeum sp. TaxID=3101447 RepID=A0A7T9I1L8_9ARCH|nr:MAG: class I SAM-dependent methyltransferase [Candidatus Diapherotrites archaeon]